MAVPCVRVPRMEGEKTRQALATYDLLSDQYAIEHDDEWLYLPLAEHVDTDDMEVTLGPLLADVSEFSIVPREPPRRSRQTLPRDILGFEPSYERLGDIILLDEENDARATKIAEAIMQSDLKAKTVLNRASPIEGERRIRQWDILAGKETKTIHTEYGYTFSLDIADVYFSPRLATERHRVIEQVTASEQVIDMFAGVGPYVIPAADQGAEVVGIDINETAIMYLQQNAEENGVADRITAICEDVRTVSDYGGWANRLIMNLPHRADEFLETAVDFAGDECVIHYYDIQHESDPFGPGEAAIRSVAGEKYEVSIETRRIVRSYAPREVNVCLDVRLTT